MSSKSNNKNFKIFSISSAHLIERRLLAQAFDAIEIKYDDNVPIYNMWHVSLNSDIIRLSNPSCTDILIRGLHLEIDSKYLTLLKVAYWRERYWYDLCGKHKNAASTYLIDFKTYYEVISHGMGQIANEFIPRCVEAIHLAKAGDSANEA